MTGDSAPFDIPPPKFGRYRVQHQIGVGATGPVFRSEDPETHAPLAIKALRTLLPPEANQSMMADLTAVIDRLPTHPSIVALRDVGLEDQEPFLVSDLVPGEALDVALKKYGPGAIGDLLPRLRSLAEALDEAAAQGLCHGAIHPRDVIVSDATAITGIGVAAVLSKHGAGVPIRRPYTPPEIGRGEPPIPASDQFSLAALSFEWLFGELITGPAYTPLEVPALPQMNVERLSDAFTTALASEAKDRFPNCRAFVDGLSAAVPALAGQAGAERFIDVPLKPAAAPPSLWDDDPELDTRLLVDRSADSEVTVAPSHSARAMFASETKTQHGFGLGALAATLFLGMGLGLVGGYLASTRLWPTTVAAAPSPAKPEVNQPSAKPAEPAAPPARELKSGTEVPVSPPAATPPTESKAPAASPARVPPKTAARPIPPAAPAAVRPATPAPSAPSRPAAAPTRPATAETGGLTIDSRPPGAAVTVNGVPRGATPLSIDNLPPGDYTVTMRLTNYRPVSMVVRVVPGERARAAASLTQVNGQE